MPRIPEASVRAALGPIDELEYLGDGSQGDVWRVRRAGQNEVLKVIVATAAHQRLAREIAGLQAVTSSHVMRFGGVLTIQHGGRDYAAILGEFIAGGTVADALDAGSWPTEGEALSAAAGVLDGLDAIHAQDLVHRDIKPQNLALRGGCWDAAVVLDLGVVRDLVGTSITVYPNLVGTVPWMAPEQLRAERAVRRSDVYAVGATLFMTVARRHPFFVSDTEVLQLPELEDRIRDPNWPDWTGPHPISPDIRTELEGLLAYEAHERPKARAASEALAALATSRGGP